MPENEWQRSSFCGGGGNNCIETLPQNGLVLMRESQDPEAIISVTPEQLAAFIQGAKAGEYDHLT
ncbi:DUF397 domain-containing protein [Streptomyces buecherae]|uniref:DUF397 domain-containing protein n=1 Tax=Streptomyces buecherae TaxID=2763006 RepID=UPI00164D2A70|nr:DUF397 domain-containing protein [Streptomyces buecherae]MBC3991042.1 DUF397 domain-containing protein [Streptomyces buecherae]